MTSRINPRGLAERVQPAQLPAPVWVQDSSSKLSGVLPDWDCLLLVG